MGGEVTMAVKLPTQKEVTRLSNRAESLAQDARIDRYKRREWAQIAERLQVLEVLMQHDQEVN